jgi:hypothetical protein
MGHGVAGGGVGQEEQGVARDKPNGALPPTMQGNFFILFDAKAL